MNKNNRIMSNNFFMFRYVMKYTPSFFVIHVLNSLFYGIVFNSATLLFTKNLYEQIETQINTQKSDFGIIVKLFMFIVIINGVAFFIDSFLNKYYFPIITNKLSEKMQTEIYEKSRQMEISKYEDPEFYDNFVWTMQQSSSKAIAVVVSISDLIKVIASIFTVGTILFTLDLFSFVFVALTVVIGFTSRMILIKIDLKKDIQAVPINRELEYVKRVLSLDTFAKELRLNNVKQLLLEKYDTFVDKQKKISIKNVRDVFFVNFTSSSLNDIVMNVAFYLILAYKIMVLKTLTIGGMITIQQGIDRIASPIRSLLYSYADFKANSLYIEKFKTFMEYRPQIADNELSLPLEDKIEILEIKNLSFSYCSSAKEALKDVSLTIHKNEKIAIVGFNGAGKSTLIKLLLRLYEPVSGNIYINSQNIQSFTLESYRNKFGTVFQDFKLFALSVAENVLMDEYHQQKEEKDIIISALDKALFIEKLSHLEYGIETQLTREFCEDGTLLSGGEMQKIAISRVFAHDNEIIILDEPSSALDPDSEYEINKLIMNETYGKTVIFISHRLSTTKMADRIYMLDQGQIIEQGTHEELMALNGSYADMFKMQAEKYI